MLSQFLGSHSTTIPPWAKPQSKRMSTDSPSRRYFRQAGGDLPSHHHGSHTCGQDLRQLWLQGGHSPPPLKVFGGCDCSESFPPQTILPLQKRPARTLVSGYCDRSHAHRLLWMWRSGRDRCGSSSLPRSAGFDRYLMYYYPNSRRGRGYTPTVPAPHHHTPKVR